MLRYVFPSTQNLVVCNAGLSTGLQQEALLAEFATFGDVENIIMVRGKSYCFVKCIDQENATTIYNATHGKCRLGQNGGVLYLSFCAGGNFVNCLYWAYWAYVLKILLPILVPQSNMDTWSQPPPNGLIVLPNIISPEEEKIFVDMVNTWSLNAIDADGEHSQALKHRRVKHFGYEFLYGKNTVDRSKPLLSQPIPKECDMLWSRLGEKFSIENRPDQLTVNVYEPGQGTN